MEDSLLVPEARIGPLLPEIRRRAIADEIVSADDCEEDSVDLATLHMALFQFWPELLEQIDEVLDEERLSYNLYYWYRRHRYAMKQLGLRDDSCEDFIDSYMDDVSFDVDSVVLNELDRRAMADNKT